MVLISHYFCPITNHGAIVCLCKRLLTLVTGSPSAHYSVQNTHGDGILCGRGGLGEHQTTWLIRQCANCICFLFVSRHLHWRHSVVIKPLSETELDKSWSGSSGSIMRWEQELQNDKCQRRTPPSGLSYCNRQIQVEKTVKKGAQGTDAQTFSI